MYAEHSTENVEVQAAKTPSNLITYINKHTSLKKKAYTQALLCYEKKGKKEVLHIILVLFGLCPGLRKLFFLLFWGNVLLDL